MKRTLPLLLIALGGCHRVTGLEGLAGETRHGNGYHVLSIITLWLSLLAMGAGAGFVARGLFRRSDREHLVWAFALGGVGVVLFLGTVVSSFGLWICHGTC